MVEKEPQAAWFSLLINVFCSGPWGKTDNWTIAPVMGLEVGIRKVFSPTRLMLVEYSWDTYRWELDKTDDESRHFKPPHICTAIKIMIQTCVHTLRHGSTNTNSPLKTSYKTQGLIPHLPAVRGVPDETVSGGALLNLGT